MLPNGFFDTTNKTSFLPSLVHVYDVNNINANYHTIHLYQIGKDMGTYLPNLLTKFFNVSHVNYTYTWINQTSVDNLNYDMPSNVNMITTGGEGVENYVYSFPITVLKKCTWIIYWCDSSYDTLYQFYVNFKKTYKTLLEKNNLLYNNWYIVIPFLSEKGSSITISRNINNFKRRWLNMLKKKYMYRHDYDMLVTMLMYNSTLDIVFKPYVYDTQDTYSDSFIYTNVGGDGTSVFKIDRALCDLVSYDMLMSNW